MKLRIRTWEVDIEVLSDSHPVSHQLQRDDVQKSLENIDSLGQLNLLAGLVSEFLVIFVADDDWSSTTGNNWNHVSEQTLYGRQDV